MSNETVTDGDCTDPDCTQAVQMLHAYIDGELEESDLGAMKVHLRRCTPCEGAVEFEASLQAVISAKCSEKVPPELRQRLLDMCSEHLGTAGPLGAAEDAG